MRKVKTWPLLLFVIGFMVASVVSISAKPTADKPAFVIRKVKPQMVLYTIYRGSYDKVGPAVGKLFALAGKKGITPRGPASYAYLNNPNKISSEHWLTEIRIPVDKEALSFTGKLGKMTDVKALPAMNVAVAVKPEGLADPSVIYNNLHTWIFNQGYMAVDGPCEIFLTNAMSGNYAQMKSEIMIPVEKFSTNKD